MQTYTVTLPSEDISKIMEALSHRPWREVNKLMGDIDAQIRGQQSPSEAPSAAAEVKA